LEIRTRAILSLSYCLLFFLFILFSAPFERGTSKQYGEQQHQYDCQPAPFSDISSEQEHLDIVSRLRGGQFNAVRDCHGNTHLSAAARLGRLRVVAYLLQRGGGDAGVNVRNAYGETPLYLAALFGHGGVVKRLLVHGGGVDAAAVANDADGNTPPHVAAEWGQAEIVGWLVCYGDGGGLLTACNKAGLTALELAVKRHPLLARRRQGKPELTMMWLRAAALYSELEVSGGAW
jgi:ankyrin repeat protein